MKYIRLLFSILYILPAIIARGDENIGGLSFRAYEYSKDERTSFIIPAGNRQLKFKDYFSLSFDLKIRPKGEHFGYVCRLILGKHHSINLLLVNPVNEDPYLCLIKDQQYLGKIGPGEKMDIHEWNRVKIELQQQGDTVYVKENGSLISKETDITKENALKVCFGANGLAPYMTSDVAPIVLRNVSIGLSPDCIRYEWHLHHAAVDTLLKDESQRMSAYIANPEWIINRHTHWKHVKTLAFSSKTYPVTDKRKSACYFVAKDRVVKYDLVRNTVKEYPFSPPIDVERITNQFLSIPRGEGESRLVYYDFEKADGEHLSFFDFEKKNWSIPIRRQRQSAYTQHNRFFSKADSSVVQLLGYGFHSYSRELNKISLSGKLVRKELEGISPRYLSAIGETDSAIYIYGGLGNDLGKQEYGVTHYRDLYKLHLEDYSLEKQWSVPENANGEVVASTLIMDEGGNMHAKGLFFSPGRFQSALVLKDLNLENGETEVLGDTLPYTFLDVNSHADLMYLSSQKSYYAITVHQVEGSDYEANIYSIASPVLPLQGGAVQREDAKWKMLWIGICVLALGIGVWKLRCWGRKRLSRTQPEVPLKPTAVHAVEIEEEAREYSMPQAPAANTTPGIYMLNGFQVINRDLKDITGKFTPIMRQLLSVIILHSNQNHKGISNVKLKELLWYDKSEESFSNNRSVNIRKIRLLLEEVGDTEISSANGYWYFFNKGRIYNDYEIAIRLINQMLPLDVAGEDDLETLLSLASSGPLLPNMQFDWVDGFKAEYSDSMIGLLSKLRDSRQFADNDKLRIRISNCILRFDSLDEESVRVKCRCLLALKRIGVANATFDQFTKEYKLILNEDFQCNFEHFINGR